MTSESTQDRKRPLILRWRAAVFGSREPSSVKLTLLALAEHANPDGTQCFPSVETLAAQTGQNEKTCRRALDAADGTWFSRTPIKLKGVAGGATTTSCACKKLRAWCPELNAK